VAAQSTVVLRLRGRAPEPALGHDARAAAADYALDLVRNAVSLHHDVHAYGLMPVGKAQNAKSHRHCYSG